MEQRLQRILTCCHPVLSADEKVALTLFEVCGLTIEQIAGAFLTSVPVATQRIMDARARLCDVPASASNANDMQATLDCALRVVYLLFNEGYSANPGPSVRRSDLAAEAIRVGRSLAALLPEPEILGLLALMLLHDSRRASRVSTNGELLLLHEQDRSTWDREQIAEAIRLLERAVSFGPPGFYATQAAIAAQHAQASTADATDWRTIVRLYDRLLDVAPSPVVELNRAVAVAMCDGPAAGLVLVENILRRGALLEYRFAHAARADLCRRLGRTEDARAAYEHALALTRQEPERRFLEKRLAELGR